MATTTSKWVLPANERLAIVRDILITAERDLYRTQLSTPADADQSGIEAQQARVDELRKEYAAVEAEVNKK